MPEALLRLRHNPCKMIMKQNGKSYLKFDKSLMINLEQSLPKEMLRTNKSGSYHCTSIVGCNTRKQHGLLVTPIPEMDAKAHVLLSSLDESVIQHGVAFNLGLHQYGDDIFSPNGHKYIREFNCDVVPKLTFRVGGVILTKEKVFLSHRNQLIIKYTLVDAHSPTSLQFRPMLAFRDANNLCVENNAINTATTPVEGGIKTCLYEGYPDLYMQFDKPAVWTPDGHWYKGIEYYKDRDRGIPYKEDLWMPGYFTVEIKKGESVIFSASTFDSDPAGYEEMFDKEIAARTARSSFYNCLKNSATQFYYKAQSGLYIMAGYPWLNVRARDELIALPGCTLAIDRHEEYLEIMNTFLSALFRNIDKEAPDRVIHEIDLPDIPLWAIWAIQQYRRYVGSEECRKSYGDAVRELIDCIRRGKIENLKLEPDGLLTSDGTDKPVTWLSASLGGRPLIPRTGRILEFNALWYNALCFAIDLFEHEDGRHHYVEELRVLAEKVKDSFIDTFLNPAGYLYDYVTAAHKDVEVRPNLAIAVGMEHSPLDRRQKRKVLDYVTRELLTPKGLRTLSPKSRDYRPIYAGNPVEREYAVHLGPARPWLFGFYAEAYLEVMGYSGLGMIERMLIGFEDEMTEGCIGSLSEMYDGNPPYTGRGAVSTAKNVGAVLSTIKRVKDINKQLYNTDKG